MQIHWHSWCFPLANLQRLKKCTPRLLQLNSSLKILNLVLRLIFLLNGLSFDIQRSTSCKIELDPQPFLMTLGVSNIKLTVSNQQMPLFWKEAVHNDDFCNGKIPMSQHGNRQVISSKAFSHHGWALHTHATSFQSPGVYTAASFLAKKFIVVLYTDTKCHLSFGRWVHVYANNSFKIVVSFVEFGLQCCRKPAIPAREAKSHSKSRWFFVVENKTKNCFQFSQKQNGFVHWPLLFISLN